MCGLERMKKCLISRLEIEKGAGRFLFFLFKAGEKHFLGRGLLRNVDLKTLPLREKI